MSYKLTDEDREKAKVLQKFKRELDKEPIIPEQTLELPQTINERVSELEGMRAKRRLRQLEENEILALELENKRMREELQGVTSSVEPKSELDLFQKFTTIQNQLSESSEKRENELRKRIVEQLGDEVVEPETAENMFLKVIANKIADGSLDIGKGKKDQPQAPIVEFQHIKETNKTDNQIIKEIPEYMKKAIKGGDLTLEQLKISFDQYAKGQGIILSPEDDQKIEEIYNQIQGKKKGVKK